VAHDERMIEDFGEQWSHYAGNEGYYGSVELLQDILGPLVSLRDLAGARVADIGSGTGRIVRMLLEAGVAHVVAVEPSAGVEKLRANTAAYGERVEVLHATGDRLPPDLGLDFVISIGVIQFIRKPDSTLRAGRAALRPGGRIVIWVYGREGNRLYIALSGLLRAVTTRLPHRLLAGFCSVLTVLVDAYGALCRVVPQLRWPLRDYLSNTFSKLSRRERTLTIYDQLNPTYAKYYRREEVVDLLERTGFADVVLHHRRGYSWTACATKPV